MNAPALSWHGGTAASTRAGKSKARSGTPAHHGVQDNRRGLKQPDLFTFPLYVGSTGTTWERDQPLCRHIFLPEAQQKRNLKEDSYLWCLRGISAGFGAREMVAVSLLCLQKRGGASILPAGPGSPCSRDTGWAAGDVWLLSLERQRQDLSRNFFATQPILACFVLKTWRNSEMKHACC